MTTSALLAFAAVALIGVLTPGLDTRVVLRNALVGGRRAGVAVVLGIALGCLVWGTASTLGLTALLVRERIRRWLDRTTAGVLVALGIAMVADARRMP